MNRSGLKTFTSGPQWIGFKLALHMSITTSLPFGIGTSKGSAFSACAELGGKRWPRREVSVTTVRGSRGAGGKRRAVSRKKAVVYSYKETLRLCQEELKLTCAHHSGDNVFIWLWKISMISKGVDISAWDWQDLLDSSSLLQAHELLLGTLLLGIWNKALDRRTQSRAYARRFLQSISDWPKFPIYTNTLTSKEENLIGQFGS